MNRHRRCHGDDAYLAASFQLQEAYGFRTLRVVSDSADLPIQEWKKTFETVEVVSSFDRSKYELRGTYQETAKGLRERFPEKRMARGELGSNATAEAWADLTSEKTLECRAVVGSFSASMSKAIFAQLLIRHRQIPPFVSVGGCVDQARFFDADGEAWPRCGPPPSPAEVSAAEEAAAREERVDFAKLQFRSSLWQAPVCAARLLRNRGILLIGGADPGAAAATVFFTAFANHCPRRPRGGRL